MSDTKGWIKLHRGICDNPIWQSEPFSRGQAWVDLLLLANHKDSYFYKRGNKVNVLRGQVGRSEVELSDRWRWSRSKVRKFLNDLKKEQQIEQQKTSVTQILTIINYDKYQEKEQQKDSRKTAEEQQKDTYKNVKNIKNDNNRATDELNLQNVLAYFDERGMKSEGYKCWNWYDADSNIVNGKYVWVTNKGNLIKNWKRACGQWIGRMSEKQKAIAKKESEGYDVKDRPTEKIKEYSKYCEDWGITKEAECYVNKETGKVQWAVGGITFYWLEQLVKEWPEYVATYEEKYLWVNWKDHWWDAAVRGSKYFINQSEKL